MSARHRVRYSARYSARHSGAEIDSRPQTREIDRRPETVDRRPSCRGPKTRALAYETPTALPAPHLENSTPYVTTDRARACRGPVPNESQRGMGK